MYLLSVGLPTCLTPLSLSLSLAPSLCFGWLIPNPRRQKSPFWWLPSCYCPLNFVHVFRWWPNLFQSILPAAQLQSVGKPSSRLGNRHWAVPTGSDLRVLGNGWWLRSKGVHMGYMGVYGYLLDRPDDACHNSKYLGGICIYIYTYVSSITIFWHMAVYARCGKTLAIILDNEHDII